MVVKNLWLAVIIGFIGNVFAKKFEDMTVEEFLTQLNPETVTIAAFTDDSCYKNMLEVDVDENYKLDKDEYVEFVKLMGPENFLSGVSDFPDLPLPLQSTFYPLSCLCPDSAKTNCCDNTIEIFGADEANPDQATKNDLYLICSLTRLAINRYLSSLDPTMSPTEAPQATPKPTPIPTPSPTPLPTAPPTPSPTSFPTPLPTPKPFAEPTPSPTPLPTPGPTPSPTPFPTPGPTPSPTPFPTPGPTPSPVVTPTQAPSESPDDNTYTVYLQYRVGVRGGTYEEEYNAELIAAMNSLAPVILSDILGDRRLGQLRRRRRLKSILLPTAIPIFLQDGK